MADILIFSSLLYSFPEITLAVIPILVAVNAAPANKAGMVGISKNTINPIAPRIKGKTTPVTATVAACVPTAINSGKSDSNPVTNNNVNKPTLFLG